MYLKQDKESSGFLVYEFCKSGISFKVSLINKSVFLWSKQNMMKLKQKLDLYNISVGLVKNKLPI